MIMQRMSTCTLLLLACGVAVSGCATREDISLAEPGDPPDSIVGTWRAVDVTRALRAPIDADLAQAYVGAPALVASETVIGLRGNRCDVPRFQVDEISSVDFLEPYGLAPDEVGIEQEMLEVVAVLCGERLFDGFIPLDDGTLINGFDGAFFRLEPFDPDADQEAVEGETATASVPDGGPYGVHLESYRDAGNAAEGWTQLQARYPQLAGLEPVVVPIDLGDRGRFQRLLGAGGSQEQMQAVCTALDAAGQYCDVMRTDRADRVAVLSAPAPQPDTPASPDIASPGVGAPDAASPDAGAPDVAAPAPLPLPEPASGPDQPAEAAGSDEDVPAPEMAAAPSPEETRRYLIGRWGLDDPDAGCGGASTLVFYPEGTAVLYDRLEGLWSVTEDAVSMSLNAYDDSGAVTDEGYELNMQLEERTPDRFGALVTRDGDQARVTAYRCP